MVVIIKEPKNYRQPLFYPRKPIHPKTSSPQDIGQIEKTKPASELEERKYKEFTGRKDPLASADVTVVVSAESSKKAGKPNRLEKILSRSEKYFKDTDEKKRIQLYTEFLKYSDIIHSSIPTVEYDDSKVINGSIIPLFMDITEGKVVRGINRRSLIAVLFFYVLRSQGKKFTFLEMTYPKHGKNTVNNIDPFELERKFDKVLEWSIIFCKKYSDIRQYTQVCKEEGELLYKDSFCGFENFTSDEKKEFFDFRSKALNEIEDVDYPMNTKNGVLLFIYQKNLNKRLTVREVSRRCNITDTEFGKAVRRIQKKLNN